MKITLMIHQRLNGYPQIVTVFLKKDMIGIIKLVLQSAKVLQSKSVKMRAKHQRFQKNFKPFPNGLILLAPKNITSFSTSSQKDILKISLNSITLGIKWLNKIVQIKWAKIQKPLKNQQNQCNMQNLIGQCLVKY